jgi:hypothetical protein
LIGLFLHPEDGSNTFLRNVAELLLDYNGVTFQETTLFGISWSSKNCNQGGNERAPIQMN